MDTVIKHIWAIMKWNQVIMKHIWKIRKWIIIKERLGMERGRRNWVFFNKLWLIGRDSLNSWKPDKLGRVLTSWIARIIHLTSNHLIDQRKVSLSEIFDPCSCSFLNLCSSNPYIFPSQLTEPTHKQNWFIRGQTEQHPKWNNSLHCILYILKWIIQLYERSMFSTFGCSRDKNTL